MQLQPAQLKLRPGLINAVSAGGTIWLVLCGLAAPGHSTTSPVELAQQTGDPLEDRFLQPLPPLPLPEEETEIERQPEQPMTPPAATEILLPVEQIEVVGSTVFTQSDFSPILQSLEGQTVSLADLQAAADAVTQLYLSQGYITSRAILPEQEITDGTVEIQVIEGQIATIEIEGNQHLRADYIRDRVALGTDTPVRIDAIEDQLRLLQLSLLLDEIDAALLPGSGTGESVLALKVREASPWAFNVSANNYSPPPIGSELFETTLANRNLIGIGDSLALAYKRTTTGAYESYEGLYRVPVNPMEGTLQIRALASNTDVPISSTLEVRGNTTLYEISFRQPLVRTPREELALSLGFSYQNGQTFLGNQPFGFTPGLAEDGISRTSVFRLGQDYLARDASGSWSARSLLSIGTGLFGATANDDPLPDGQFLSWLGQVQRYQRLTPNNMLVIQAAVQLTPDTLLPSEQFVIGGGRSLRGYRQNARADDNGFRLSVEDRIVLARDDSRRAVLQIAPFADLGAVWNQPDSPNSDDSGDNFLASVGTGIQWNPLPELSFRLDYGLPLVNVSGPDDNLQDQGLYFSVDLRL